jgi:hypothetical protein
MCSIYGWPVIVSARGAENIPKVVHKFISNNFGIMLIVTVNIFNGNNAITALTLKDSMMEVRSVPITLSSPMFLCPLPVKFR